MQTGPFLSLLFRTRGTIDVPDKHGSALNCLRGRDAAGAADAIAKDLADSADFVSDDAITATMGRLVPS
jgi:hypothetical protein